MKVKYLTKSEFLSVESITENKVFLNICTPNEYGITDSNEFYSLYYTKPKIDFNKIPTNERKFGSIFFTDIFSYHKICHMICVEWPKSQYNMTPFKHKYFEKCLDLLSEYIISNNIKIIYTPVFARDIFQGNWTEILSSLNAKLGKDDTLNIFK